MRDPSLTKATGLAAGVAALLPTKWKRCVYGLRRVTLWGSPQ